MNEPSVVAIGAHPDDVELAAGATLHALARRGFRVTIVHLTRGEASSRGDPVTRRREAREAADLLRAAQVEWLDLGDARLEDSIANREAVLPVLRRERPRLVLAPLPSDEHPDHAAAGRLVRSTWYLSGIARVGPAGPADRAPLLWFYPAHELARPDHVFVVGAEDVEAKRRALECYRSQFFLSDDGGTARTRLTEPHFLESVFARMRVAGALVEAEFAEPFFSLRPLAIRDPRSLLPEADGP